MGLGEREGYGGPRDVTSLSLSLWEAPWLRLSCGDLGQCKALLILARGGERRRGAARKGNLASTYHSLGRFEDARSLTQEIYAGMLRLHGAESPQTIEAANSLAAALSRLQRFEEARSLLRNTIPLAQRVVGHPIVGEDRELTLIMKLTYARCLYKDDGATLDDLREAVNTLEDTERTARRVLGAAHPLVQNHIGRSLGESRATLRARETPSPAESA